MLFTFQWFCMKDIRIYCKNGKIEMWSRNIRSLPVPWPFGWRNSWPSSTHSREIKAGTKIVNRFENTRLMRLCLNVHRIRCSTTWCTVIYKSTATCSLAAAATYGTAIWNLRFAAAVAVVDTRSVRLATIPAGGHWAIVGLCRVGSISRPALATRPTKVTIDRRFVASFHRV